jgi:hypothetical protein
MFHFGSGFIPDIFYFIHLGPPVENYLGFVRALVVVS